MSRKSGRVLALSIPGIDDVFPSFKRGDFTVFFGPPLCRMLLFLLSVRCQLPPEKGGLNSEAVYIDGGNTFDPYAVSAIAREQGLKPESVLDKIFISRAFTVYQLTALVFEKLEEALKRSESSLVVISDITGLFLDRDVPETEAGDVFIKMVQHLSDLASKDRVIIAASCFPRNYSKRSLFMELLLFGRATTVIELRELRGVLKFVLKGRTSVRPFTIDFPSDAVTMERFMEAQMNGKNGSILSSST